MTPHPPRYTLFPYTTLFRSAGKTSSKSREKAEAPAWQGRRQKAWRALPRCRHRSSDPDAPSENGRRSEEHTSELQSLTNLVCRLLLEKKNNKPSNIR